MLKVDESRSKISAVLHTSLMMLFIHSGCEVCSSLLHFSYKATLHVNVDLWTLICEHFLLKWKAPFVVIHCRFNTGDLLLFYIVIGDSLQIFYCGWLWATSFNLRQKMEAMFSNVLLQMNDCFEAFATKAYFLRSWFLRELFSEHNLWAWWTRICCVMVT